MMDRGHRKERGQTTAEFVVVLPFILLLLFLIIDFAWLFKNWIVVTNSAREAARCTVAASCQLDGSDVSPEALAIDRINAGITGNLVNVTVPPPEYMDSDGNGTPSAGDSIIICVDSDNDWIGPVFDVFTKLFGSDSFPERLPVRAREEMILERDPGYAMTESTDNGACAFS
jgi:TadE-like protein